jgi:hypothetical protein
VNIYTLADEMECWAFSILRKAFKELALKRRGAEKLLTVSSNRAGLMYLDLFIKCKNIMADQDKKYASMRNNYDIVCRCEKEKWSIYLDKTKPAIRKMQREQRKKRWL